MRTSRAKVATAFFWFVAGVLFLAPMANANLKEMKAYKQAFPDAKIKCIGCHAVEKPSKESPHTLNAYGQAVLKAEKNLTAEIFKKLGRAEDFKKK